eukprot:GFYU01007596.1.p1 GENE.GFYU01007596.1~~GFYU01007596.1.p1  ORF type:complete len:734 (-),score=272.81 GFYU01007596.1:489-2657(-)
MGKSPKNSPRKSPKASPKAKAPESPKTAAKVAAKGPRMGGNEFPGKKNPVAPPTDYLEQRVALWKKLYEAQQAAAVATGKPIKIEANGKTFDGKSGVTTPTDIAKELKCIDTAVIAQVDGKTMWDMNRPVEASCSLKFFDFDSEEGQHTFWHSSAHILGQSIEKKWPAHLCVGPPVEQGFYYDAHLGGTVVKPEDLKDLEKICNKIIGEKQPYERLSLRKEDALEMFKHNPYKVEIISTKVPDGEHCTAYRCGPLIDLCRGPHVSNTGKIKAMEVNKHSSSYWLGKAENDSLQRVYGISFPDKKRLKEYQHFIEEAQKRDHRVLGVKQELFFFDAISPGSCFFLPHGTRIYNKLVNFIKAEYWKRGYEEVVSPNVFNLKLWETSGHLANYKENMFIFKVEDEDFGMKPMNCPGHCVMFSHRPRSYRELPLRLADFGVLHRNELSGALSGLTRVRRFQQDDAHIFCRQDQVFDEVNGVLDMFTHIYGIFGMKFELALSTRPEKYLGDISIWDKAEADLTNALNSFKDKTGHPWKLNPADGAFYGPKIDITVLDALNRKFQCATIQLDFQLPIRFKLEFSSEVGADEGTSRVERPVIIHRAMLGSVERMFAILLEHFGGKWPFWLSPRQCIIVPVSEKQADYAAELKEQIHAAGYYVDADVSNRKMQKKVREAQLAQYNYILVVGDDEKEKKVVNVRTRDNVVHGIRSLPELLADFQDDLVKFK